MNSLGQVRSHTDVTDCLFLSLLFVVLRVDPLRSSSRIILQSLHHISRRPFEEEGEMVAATGFSSSSSSSFLHFCDASGHCRRRRWGGEQGSTFHSLACDLLVRLSLRCSFSLLLLALERRGGLGDFRETPPRKKQPEGPGFEKGLYSLENQQTASAAYTERQGPLLPCGCGGPPGCGNSSVSSQPNPAARRAPTSRH